MAAVRRTERQLDEHHERSSPTKASKPYTTPTNATDPMHTTQSFTRFIVFLAALTTAVTASLRADEPNTSNDKEKTLLAVLRSDASPSEKAIACKKLAIDGSNEAVPDLAKLLSDPQLSSWARIALEVIPGEDAKKALRDAAKSLNGKLLVGMINSIGVRRDAKAVDSLTTRLQDNDTEVASAAAIALGRIGDAAATQSLRQALATVPANVRSAVAEGSGRGIGAGDWTCAMPEHWLFAETGRKKGDSIKGLLGWEWHGAPRMDLPGMNVVAEGDALAKGKRWAITPPRSTTVPKTMLSSTPQPSGGPMVCPARRVMPIRQGMASHNRARTNASCKSPTICSSG